jgi:hypothetical protein
MTGGETVALVAGADDAVGGAIVRGLLGRDVAKVYVMSADPQGDPWHPGAVEILVAPAGRADARHLARQLARRLSDVTLLICCTVATADDRADRPPLTARPPRPGIPAEDALALMEAFAPVLAHHGGGTVVEVVTVPCPDHPARTDRPRNAPVAPRQAEDRRRRLGLRKRWAAQQTRWLSLQVELGLGSREQQLDDHRALAGHVAAKLLARLDAQALRREQERTD